MDHKHRHAYLNALVSDIPEPVKRFERSREKAGIRLSKIENFHPETFPYLFEIASRMVRFDLKMPQNQDDFLTWVQESPKPVKMALIPFSRKPAKRVVERHKEIQSLCLRYMSWFPSFDVDGANLSMSSEESASLNQGQKFKSDFELSFFGLIDIHNTLSDLRSEYLENGFQIHENDRVYAFQRIVYEHLIESVKKEHDWDAVIQNLEGRLVPEDVADASLDEDVEIQP